MAPHEVPSASRAELLHMNWPRLIQHCRQQRQEARASAGVPFVRLSLATTPSGGCRLYALGTPASSSHQTLLTSDLPCWTGGEGSGATGATALLQPLFQPDQFKSTPSAEFSLMCERQRSSVVTGVSEYTLDSTSRHILLTTGESVYRFSQGHLSEVDQRDSGFVFDVQIAPCDSSLISFVLNKQVHVERNGHLMYSTRSDSSTLTNGVPSFIAQEELDRFTACWWSPCEPRLLFERVDESMVKELSFSCPGRDLPSSGMRYPTAGSENAHSELRMIMLEGVTSVEYRLRVPLKERFPWFEYLARAGWLSDGKTVWVKLLNRAQTRCAVVVLPESEWFGLDEGRGLIARASTLIEETSNVWINVHNLTACVSAHMDSIDMIHASEKHSHCHLVHVSAEVNAARELVNIRERPVTHGDYSVCKTSGFVLDRPRQLVYFLANHSHPTDTNLCVASYAEGDTSDPRQLTDGDLTYKLDRAAHSLCLLPGVGFTCWLSNIGQPPVCHYYALVQNEGRLPAAVWKCQVVLPGSSIPPRVSAPDMPPQMIDITMPSTGLRHFAMVLRPSGWRANTCYPVIHYVYAGPGIQLVKNDWSSWAAFTRYTRLGFVVVMLDGRGSSNRGRDFEAPIKFRLGDVELCDQVEGLQEVSRQTEGLCDMRRVAVQGWSYGGYMSLLALAKYPHVYRCAVAGGAVTDWQLYDTAYTERYLGYPLTPAYHRASIAAAVDQLPDEPGRLLIVHGLIDENVHFRHTETLIEQLLKAGKPYQLQVFPSERHGVRHLEAAAHLDASTIHFIANALRG